MGWFDRVGDWTCKMVLAMAMGCVVETATGSVMAALLFTVSATTFLIWVDKDHFYSNTGKEYWVVSILTWVTLFFYWGWKWVPDLLNYLTYLRVSGSI